MDKKLTIIELAEQVAAKAQTTNRMGELFLKELFATVAQELIEGRNVEIKSLGNFVLSEGSGADEPCVDFTPAQAVAEAVNQPFAQFTPLELSDDITPEQLQLLEEVEPEPEKAPIPEEVVEPEPENEPEEIMEPEPVVEAAAVMAAPAPAEPSEISGPSEPSEISENSEPSEVAEAPEAHTAPAVDAVDHEAEKRKVAKSSLLKGIVVGALGALLLTTLLWILFGPKGVFTGNGSDKKEVATTDSTAVATEKSADVKEVAPAIPSIFEMGKQDPVEPKKEIPVIRDTVTAKRPLTVIARKHYGNEFFYVYIYEENKDRISDVNNIAPGTEVIIPLASKYGFDPKDPESIKQAQLKSMEINKKR